MISPRRLLGKGEAGSGKILGETSGGGQTNLRGSKVVMMMWSHDVIGWAGDQESAEEKCKHQGLEKLQQHCVAHPLPHWPPHCPLPRHACAFQLLCFLLNLFYRHNKPLWLEENSFLVTHDWITCTSCLCSWPENKVQFHKRRESAGSHPKRIQQLVCSRALQAYMSQRVLRKLVQ